MEYQPFPILATTYRNQLISLYLKVNDELGTAFDKDTISVCDPACKFADPPFHPAGLINLART
jgi:hypothetical protein